MVSAWTISGTTIHFSLERTHARTVHNPNPVHEMQGIGHLPHQPRCIQFAVGSVGAKRVKHFPTRDEVQHKVVEIVFVKILSQAANIGMTIVLSQV